MSKFRALVVSTLLATALVGGAVSATDASAAKKPTAPSLKDGSHWCC